jgi:Calcineurin-like phosphoesterase/Haemolysin secretion/activation protein ShlB/FhaC/HecB
MSKAIFWLPFVFITLNLAAQDNFRVYLIGDAGKVSVGDAPYKKLLQQQLNDSVPSAIVFLGDNIYPKGMPGESNKHRNEARKILEASLNLAPGFKGPIIFVPGNHDWKRGKPDGINFIGNQQAWLDSLHRGNVKLLPQNGCPGPVEIPLSDQVMLIIIDTQWWLHPWEKPEGETSLCECKTQADLIVQLDDALRRNANKRVIVAAHHPVITYGEHGGVFSLKDHIFPFTDLNKKLYIPLPVVGSIYPMYRKLFGNIQDTAHPEYRKLKDQLMQVLEQYPGVIYASGHDHSLQYSEKKKVHYVVSGGGSKFGTARKKKYARYVAESLGYVRVRVSNQYEAKLEYISHDEIAFEKNIEAIDTLLTDSASAILEYSKTVLANASNQYAAGKSHRKWLGENYRAEWALKIDVPVFNMNSEHGGLKIIQRGGGHQTISLRLEDSKGRAYSLRSIEKYPESALPEPFRNTFAEDIVQDQISASHPYGALVVPFLAEGAGIYHTNPKVVWVPDDPRFGVYRKDVANKLMLFEERPDGSGKGLDFFGNADKMISSTKLLEQLAKDNDNAVDQKFFLRSRLFDLWIGDWDRHDDQWRWAEFDSKKGKTYRPIPRDRDQAFFVSEGRIPSFLGKKWLLFQFEGFDDNVRWPSGLMFSGRYIDRNFLTTLSREDWIAVADDLASHLTDSLIDASLKQWPAEIYKLHGEKIASTLKARRKNLREDALKHYTFLAKEVSVTGSDKRERFEVERLQNGNVKLCVFKLNKDSEKGKLLYERLFLQSETQEIRLYGLGAEDQFVITGDLNKKIKVRIIGGAGKDEVESLKDKGTFVYDLRNDISFSENAHVKDRTATDPKINDYNWKDFKYDRAVPLIYANYNIDDGVFLGGGFIKINQGFRKDPFGSKHLFLASYAANTSSFNFRYDGRFTGVVGNWNAEIDADIKVPNYVNNFFGWGNESVFDKNINDEPGIEVGRAINYYRVRFQEMRLDLKLSRRLGNVGFFKIGPSFQRLEIEDTDGKDRYVSDEYIPTHPLIESDRNYLGILTSWGIDKRNNPLLTTRGVYLEQNSRYMNGFDTDNFTSHNATLSFYQAFKIPTIVTFAFRAGGGFNTGKYEFYQAQVLDGKTEIRGFRKTRFYGDRKLFFNNEVRLKLTSFQSYLFPAHLGILAFYDVGRVWYKDPVTNDDPTAGDGKSNVWHQGFGGGIWFTPFNLTVLSTEVGHSKEGTVFYVRLGFLF